MSTPFQQAFERLLQSAPGPVFPRARDLYLRKYSLEPTGDSAPPSVFRTFLWEEEVVEEPGLLRVSARRFAVVHWHGPEMPLPAYAEYLHERWGLLPDDLVLVEAQAWFREGGPFASFSTPAFYERTLPQAAS